MYSLKFHFRFPLKAEILDISIVMSEGPISATGSSAMPEYQTPDAGLPDTDAGLPDTDAGLPDTG